MKKLPVEIEDYIDVINNCYYVDKTMIIKEILSMPPTSVILFTRPRRFGKSLTLSIIKTFFDKMHLTRY
ncbi:MAG: AAA family ATPase [Clostridia bacterium]|nr:AAA family ATPase [Clostridia bacterium]